MNGLKVKDGIVTHSAIFRRISEGWVEATDGAGIGWVQNEDGSFSPPPKDPVPEPTIQDQIDALERSVTYRRVREAILSANGKAWLQDIDDQIKALRDEGFNDEGFDEF